MNAIKCIEFLDPMLKYSVVARIRLAGQPCYAGTVYSEHTYMSVEMLNRWITTVLSSTFDIELVDMHKHEDGYVVLELVAVTDGSLVITC